MAQARFYLKTLELRNERRGPKGLHVGSITEGYYGLDDVSQASGDHTSSPGTFVSGRNATLTEKHLQKGRGRRGKHALDGATAAETEAD